MTKAEQREEVLKVLEESLRISVQVDRVHANDIKVTVKLLLGEEVINEDYDYTL